MQETVLQVAILTTGGVAQMATLGELEQSVATRLYMPHSKKANDCTSVWYYFLQEEGRHTAKCKMCSAILRTTNSATSCLLSHLYMKHSIDLRAMRLFYRPEDQKIMYHIRKPVKGPQFGLTSYKKKEHAKALNAKYVQLY
ncbi:unnamed protein product [Acanthoscelides obtectus]|uniref:BED-type domain-containing protein n=1 Tax=Acanthoscelides obtectus TaxID=200917 RepID=A0A9P0K2I0_ACAOB|nr:unnamed protein product [Acanthoscelides obtectus]CAK1669650.1 hypothetical protein AOBTE_LOCUS27130 [Acanthoscelides obtectus]